MISAQKIEIGSGTIFRILLIILGFMFLYLIRDIIIMLLAAFVIASAIEPIARRLRRYGVPRGASVVIVYVLVIAIFVLTVALIVPALAQQTAALIQSVSQVLQDVYQYIVPTGQVEVKDTVGQLRSSLSGFGGSFSNVSLNIFQQTRSVFSGIVSVIFTFIIALYLVIEEDAIKKMFRLVIPQRHIAYVERIIDRVQAKIGRWVIAQLSLAIIIGVVVGIGLWTLGVQHALALGLLAGVLEIIPVIGPIIAGFIGTLVALSQSLLLGLATIVFYVVVQQVENHALIPNVMRKATGLNPLVTLVAVLLGARLAGVVGVILAVPVATMINVFLSDFFTKSGSHDELAG